MVAQLCENIKNHWIVHFKLVNCRVCEFCFDEAFNKEVVLGAPEKQNYLLNVIADTSLAGIVAWE